MKKILIIFFILFSLIGCEQGSKLKLVTGVSVEKEEEMKKIFEECGFEEKISRIEYDETLDNTYGEGNKGYRISYEIYDVYFSDVELFLKPDGSVSVIKWETKNLYIDGEVIDDIRNYFMTAKERNEYVEHSQRAIKEILKSPSSAKFPNVSYWYLKKNEGKVIIESYVDSQNSFGAMIRADFQITIDFKTKRITSLIFEGKRVR